MIDILAKDFHALTKQELYEILKLRQDIFILKQNSHYLDIDNNDQNAILIVGYKSKKIVAYARILKSDDKSYATFGRVLLQKDERKYGYDKSIVKKCLETIAQKLDKHMVKISAQSYLTNFYRKFGFIQVGKEYIDEGVPHKYIELNLIEDYKF